MCQVFAQSPDRKNALLLLWYATSGHLFGQPIPAGFSLIEPLNVDLNLGQRSIAELQQRLVELDLPIVPLMIMEPERPAYPNPEVTHWKVGEELRTMSIAPAPLPRRAS